MLVLGVERPDVQVRCGHSHVRHSTARHPLGGRTVRIPKIKLLEYFKSSHFLSKPFGKCILRLPVTTCKIKREQCTRRKPSVCGRGAPGRRACTKQPFPPTRAWTVRDRSRQMGPSKDSIGAPGGQQAPPWRGEARRALRRAPHMYRPAALPARQ